jgi:hypothetical protein
MDERPTSRIERLVAGTILCLAFLVMASIIVPAPTQAGAQRESAPGVEPLSAMAPGPAGPPFSTDPHDGLRALGTLERSGCMVTIFATTLGPRFTIRDLENGEELGTLLDAQQVHAAFPDLDLPRLDFSADEDRSLMLAEPEWP